LPRSAPAGGYAYPALIADRPLKYRAVATSQKYLFNPIVRRVAGSRLARSVALLETIGRRSGEPRRTPVGNGLDGDTFWIVSEHGRRAGYISNIRANPRVRVKAGGEWRSGTAHVLEDDDTRERQRRMPNRLNSAVVRAVGTDLITVRIDLDRGDSEESR
jgi:deazaflavin-dependent oxidoreductase (nitroreductase family)